MQPLHPAWLHSGTLTNCHEGAKDARCAGLLLLHWGDVGGDCLGSHAHWLGGRGLGAAIEQARDELGI